MKRNPRHRSSISTLEQLASEHVFLHTRGERTDVLGRFPLGKVGLAISRYLANRFGADREGGIRTCAREAAELLGVSKATVRGAVKRGELAALRVGNQFLIAREALERVARQSGTPASATPTS